MCKTNHAVFNTTDKNFFSMMLYFIFTKKKIKADKKSQEQNKSSHLI